MAIIAMARSIRLIKKEESKTPLMTINANEKLLYN